MEPPPRLYHYEGLFTSVRSIDLPLKILLVLLVLISLIVIAAWILSRKTYKRAPLDGILASGQLSDLSSAEAIDLLLRDEEGWQSGLLTGRIYGRTALIINDWKVVCLYESKASLDYYFSAAPNRFRRKWFGLWLSDYTLSHRSHIRAIVFHMFDTLSPNAYALIGSFAVRSIGAREYLVTDRSFDLSEWDRWIWDLVMELVFFNSPDFISPELSESFATKQSLLQCLRRRMLDVLELHRYGSIRSKTGSVFSSSDVSLITELDKLLSPLVRYAIDTFMRYRSEYSVNQELPPEVDATNLLHQFVQAHHHLEAEGEFVGFLKPFHVSHILVEITLILRNSLQRMLKVLFTVLALRSDWQHRLRDETKKALTFDWVCPKRSTKKRAESLPPGACLNLKHIECLPWTKALVNEAMRFVAPEFPIYALREAPRDGCILDFDYAEGELILFNQLVYFNDKHLWETDRVAVTDKPKDCEQVEGASRPQGVTGDKPHFSLPFNPHRFLQPIVSNSNEQVQLDLPVHWARHMLVGYTVCVPNDCVYRLITAILTHLFGRGLTVSIKEPMEVNLVDNEVSDVLWLPKELPPINCTFPIK